MDNRAEIRAFLTSRRAKISPKQAGLPAGGGVRRVPGLRREEVAVLAGVSTDWYVRLEKGHISGVSEDVLDAVARALRLTEAERTYLFDLARAAKPVGRAARRRRRAELPPSVQWMLDSITSAAALVRNGRMDLLATNSLGRALYAPLYDDERRPVNIARFHFLDPRAHDMYPDWDGAAHTIVALLRTDAGRNPYDKDLRDLIGELSTLSEEFRTLWAGHDVRLHSIGMKQFHHVDVGTLDLVFHSMELPTDDRSALDLTIYTAEPGSPTEDALKLLASWAATHEEQAETTDEPHR
ncbi:helix-turn-helix transcriptional regulator [Kribbella caucasensis]|uniref:helix-turn-helix transcriptional regulator n=1 Tax=Kribbella caucasensis TaxID=2512215 RepID=UPI00192D86EB|nr:helix-turn-helix transcriptional regulator [Kribbella sp. VKM Ac-2527]